MLIYFIGAIVAGIFGLFVAAYYGLAFFVIVYLLFIIIYNLHKIENKLNTPADNYENNKKTS
ncbi:hypothetical protein [Clostridium tunisiense]|uniref:hypothetical protein n=1 Tax=Clostridium tunisiense TaxID=219748 RepID=UPI0002EE3653|nr:hypothetical protein [Clostridium tunisiense]